MLARLAADSDSNAAVPGFGMVGSNQTRHDTSKIFGVIRVRGESDLLNRARTPGAAAPSVQGAGRLARGNLAALSDWLVDSVPGCGRHPP